MDKTTTCFLHGLDSSGNGTKGQFFARYFPEILRPDFEGTLSNRLEQLERLCHNRQPMSFIGSSYGGLLATCYALLQPEKVTRLILLAPALNYEGFRPPAKPLQTATYLLIGKHDTVTPAGDVIPLAEATFAHLKVSIEDDDHMLHKTFQYLNWQELLLG
ncbi:MAG: alpha/beta hydrolase [Desulforhopalus sp.]